MTFDEYQELSRKFDRGQQLTTPAYAYYTMGLAGEAGEACDEFKKACRFDGGELSADAIAKIRLELGDVFWYIARLADQCGITMDDIARANLQKLQGRSDTDKLLKR